MLTMLVGNLAALVQTNVKRMLAYSSIAHAGYILVAFAASTAVGTAALLFYLAAYVLMKVGAFLVVTHLGQQGEKRVEIRDYAGLGMKQPMLAACFSLFLLSLLGLPATGGFLGKFFAFQSALDLRQPAFVWLVVIAAVNSVIGAYYYLRVIIVMYFSEPRGITCRLRLPLRLPLRWCWRLPERSTWACSLPACSCWRNPPRTLWHSTSRFFALKKVQICTG